MKLSDLEPQFIRYETRTESWETTNGTVTGPREYKVYVSNLVEAQGIMFLCPKCFVPGGVGVHLCEVTFAGRGVLENQGTHNKHGQPVRWGIHGTGYNDLTTQPSILLEGGCAWHGFITAGEIL